MSVRNDFSSIKRGNFNASLSLSLTELIIDRDIKFFFLMMQWNIQHTREGGGEENVMCESEKYIKEKNELELEKYCIRANLTIISHSMSNNNNGQWMLSRWILKEKRGIYIFYVNRTHTHTHWNKFEWYRRYCLDGMIIYLSRRSNQDWICQFELTSDI